ncbi:glycosyltransferase family 4 protein [Mucilaginibacter psychrotolerans]|uniref:Glycosyltransferase n=1 Tax=Mucilaginibacter psychrotolerans TaxID=1524096 RepID=A0A4Y8SI77_9SPHI|nr:glycosyltransferase family 4 protein [Mucilaginibacter psychrotolerans]TFF38793.1 glycosyltransferase [Mucilaginibacter psychrotolerans]
MKVVILCANYEPGGAQRAVLRLHNQLNNNNIKCICIFMHRKSMDFSDSPTLLLEKKISSAGDVWTVCKNWSRVLKAEKPDAVISFLPYANILGQLISYFSGVKVRISSHRNLSEKELSKPIKTLDYLWAKLGIYTGITAVSKSTKNSFSYYGKAIFSKLKVINNGISFAPSALSKDECRKNLGIDQTAFIIGNVGRLVEQKNQILLINILPKLKDILLVIVGKGPLRAELDNRAAELGVKNQLLFIDELTTHQIPLFLKAIDIFVMPSNFEGMSNALAEALYAGLPIVSSDVESQSDVLLRDTDGLESGIMVSNDDPEGWIIQINAIKNDEALRTSLSERAILRSKDFTVQHMANGFITMLHQTKS